MNRSQGMLSDGRVWGVAACLALLVMLESGCATVATTFESRGTIDGAREAAVDGRLACRTDTPLDVERVLIFKA